MVLWGIAEREKSGRCKSVNALKRHIVIIADDAEVIDTTDVGI